MFLHFARLQTLTHCNLLLSKIRYYLMHCDTLCHPPVQRSAYTAAKTIKDIPALWLGLKINPKCVSEPNNCVQFLVKLRPFSDQSKCFLDVAVVTTSFHGCHVYAHNLLSRRLIPFKTLRAFQLCTYHVVMLCDFYIAPLLRNLRA